MATQRGSGERVLGALALAPESGAPSDRATLVVRAQQGDREALGQIVRAELPRVDRLLHRMLGPRRDMEDLLQTVLLEFCKALPRFRGESALSTFVGGIAVRVAMRAMRSSPWVWRRGPMPDPAVGGAESSPEERAQASRQCERLRQHLARIKPAKRVAFTLWALEGMDVVTIAAHTGASVAATRARIAFARKELRQLAAKDPWLRELIEEVDP